MLIKRISFLLSLCAVFACILSLHALVANASDVSYKLKREGVDRLSVEVAFRGNASGSTEVCFSVLSGIEHEASDFVASSGTHLLKVKKKISEKCTSGAPYVCQVVSILHKPGADILVSYRVQGFPGVFISDDAVVFEGGKVLIYPDLKAQRSITASLDFSGLKVNSGKVMSPSTIENIQRTLSISKNSLFSSWFIFTNSEVTSKLMQGQPDLLVTTVGIPTTRDLDKSALTATQLAELSRKITSYNQRFVESILGQHSTRNPKGIILVHTSATDVWVGFKAHDISLVLITKDRDRKQIAHTISHEYMHEVFSAGSNLSVGFGQNCKCNRFWFDEGFADHYADLLNYRNGIITEREYLESINNALEVYSKSYRHVQDFLSMPYSSQTSVASAILSSDEFFPAFYTAGMFIAFDLDYMINQRSHGKLGLDDLLQKLVQSSCKSLPCYINQQQFVNVLGQLLDARSANFFAALETYTKKHIIDFIPIELPEHILEKKATLAYKKAHKIHGDFGFNINKSLSTGLLSGVSEKSNAYRAGARNGMKLKNLDFVFFTEKEPYAIEVEAPDLSISTIKYMPLGTIMVPYYKLH